ncbi:DUF1648 domain-containing protein [Lacticaseibacillus absianus]|uniref:DUF1648 domain-containing protein n=1 Tax=Lacticaseibacillus absianus TaxID=2729623 RepID=UPI0015CBCF12|nr:DUF1648 domain-containing protein [Lacticaseibacillus absianus]
MKERHVGRQLALTLPVILAPILYGLTIYRRLPARIAIHWGVNNTPNGWASRPMFVFGLPLMMCAFQLLVLLVPRGKQSAPRFERIVIWLMPLMTVILYLATAQIALGAHIDVWRLATGLIGVMFIAMGNYIPTIPAGYSYGLNTMRWLSRRAQWPRVARRLGRWMVLAGLGLLISLALAPAVSIVILVIACVGLLVAPLIAK